MFLFPSDFKQRTQDIEDFFHYLLAFFIIEFTVIGAAANEAARIEGLCKPLDVNFLISEQVREHLKGKWQSLGKHALRGVGDEIEVFTVKS